MTNEETLALWQAREREVLEYLEKLEPNQLPMPMAYWNTIWGFRSRDAGWAFKLMKTAGPLYRQRVARWHQDLVDDVAAFYVPGKQCVDRVALALKYHQPHDSMNFRVNNIQRKLRERMNHAISTRNKTRKP